MQDGAAQTKGGIPRRSQALGAIGLGANAAGGREACASEISDVIVFSRVLSDTERRDLETFLNGGVSYQRNANVEVAVKQSNSTLKVAQRNSTAEAAQRNSTV